MYPVAAHGSWSLQMYPSQTHRHTNGPPSKSQAPMAESSHPPLRTHAHSSCWHGGHADSSSCCTESPVHAHVHRIEGPSPRNIEKEINERTDQTALIRCRIGPDEQTVCRWPALSIPLDLYFPTLIPSHTTFPCLKVFVT